MLRSMSVAINGRPIVIASYAPTELGTHRTPMREQFPQGDYMGGHSDGLVYESIFAGGNLAQTYAMIRTFLAEEGYAELPLPEDVEELRHFQLKTRNRQVLMFEDNGYVQNPVKILFPTDGRKKTTLRLLIYNERAAQHLLRFHNKL
jgi:hypothetical protein